MPEIDNINSITKQYCEYFGVDSININQVTDLQYGDVVTKYDKISSCFGLFEEVREVKFYDIKVTWTVDDKSFTVQLRPIIKKIKDKRNTRYELNESAMKLLVLKIIKDNYKL